MPEMLFVAEREHVAQQATHHCETGVEGNLNNVWPSCGAPREIQGKLLDRFFFVVIIIIIIIVI